MMATDLTCIPGKSRNIRGLLSAPVDASSLAVFRILFGCIMAGGMMRLLLKGWVKTLYLDPAFHFPWLAWVTPWPGNWMYLHVTALVILATGIALGFCYRVSAILFCLGFTYLEFIDRTTYLNHYYLVSLLSALLVCVPAHGKWSLDARLYPHKARETVPAWSIWVFRFQITVIFLFSGIAKLNADWLFHAQPLRVWLTAKSDLLVVGPWLAQPSVAWIASWFGAIYDLSIPFLLFSARTRLAGFFAILFFHVLTALLFPIGIFPWLMIASSLLFFPPDWPRRIRAFHRSQTGQTTVWDHRPLQLLSRPALILLAVYCGIQILVPLRSWCYPQQGAWDGRGFNFSWRVMLVEKCGHVDFYDFDPLTGERQLVDLRPYITARQRFMMAQDPYLIRQFAQFLGRKLTVELRGHQIQVDAFATLNGYPSQPLIRSEVNLAAQPSDDWVVPFTPGDR
jgi:vitamin K-dependent gamma-carboxylase